MPKAAEVDDIEKKEGNDNDSVDIGTVPVDPLQFSPHHKFVEGETQSDSINDRKTKPGLFASRGGQEEVAGDGQKNDAISEVVEVNAADS